jgi:hypothetical protein
MLLLCEVGAAWSIITHGTVLSPSRKYNKNIDFDAYKTYRNARNRPPPTPPTANDVLASSVVDEVIPGTEDSPAGIPPAAPANSSEPAAPYPTSFAHIVELITSGQPVPGIKDIPPTVLEGQGTEPTKPRRKKPWEKEESQVKEAEVNESGVKASGVHQ